MEDIHRLAARNLVKFLAADLTNNRDLNDAQRAALEKAICCIESAYGFDASQRNHPDAVDLLDLVRNKLTQEKLNRKG